MTASTDLTKQVRLLALDLVKKGIATDEEKAVSELFRAHPGLYRKYNSSVLNGSTATIAKADEDTFDRVHKLALGFFNSGEAKTLSDAVTLVAQEHPMLYTKYADALGRR